MSTKKAVPNRGNQHTKAQERMKKDLNTAGLGRLIEKFGSIEAIEQALAGNGQTRTFAAPSKEPSGLLASNVKSIREKQDTQRNKLIMIKDLLNNVGQFESSKNETGSQHGDNENIAGQIGQISEALSYSNLFLDNIIEHINFLFKQN